MKEISLTTLKTYFSYDEDTGVFTRIKTVSNRSKVGDLVKDKDGKGYVRVNVCGMKYMAHRLAWLYVYGEFPKNMIDHINSDRSDNRIINLRDVTNQENHRNKTLLKNNKSGVMGVGWCKKRNRWRATITVDLKHVYLGVYKNFFDACCARKSKESKLGFHPNHGRGEFNYNR